MLTFQTAQDRLLIQKKINMLLVAEPGKGKTFSARFLDAATTLFMDCEAGTLSLEKSKDFPAWQGTTMSIQKMSQEHNIHPWLVCKAIASLLHGPDLSDEDGSYGTASYQSALQHLAGGNPDLFAQFQTIFVDSLSVVSRWAFHWACQQDECISDKTGKLDKRGAYGLMGTELVKWATILQHQPKNIILSCILQQEEDDFGRKSWGLQVEGQQAAKKIPGIFDLVTTLAHVDFGAEHGGEHRVFVTQENNPHGYPAKDRSGVLEPYEQTDLGALISKIQNFQSKTQQGA